ncbi:MAG: AIPR family protein [Ardenticatenaceae bacterium]|nr:AIPR family protein [Ardenticatenaceae bacterium]
MPFSIDDFILQVNKEVDFLFDSYSHIKGIKDTAFAQWALMLLFPSIDSDQAFNLLVVDDPWNISAKYRDDESGMFYLLHTRYSENPTATEFGPGVIYTLLDAYKTVIDRSDKARESSSVLAEAIQAVEDGYVITPVLVLFGTLAESVETSDLIRNYELAEDQFVYYDIHELRHRFAGLEEAMVGEIMLPLISWMSYSGPVEALVGNTTAYEFKRAIRDFVPEIYDGNLRAPLGAKKTKINKQMHETLSHENRKKFFWYYNNGITMLCQGFHKYDGDGHSFIVKAPRIVNGAQTTDTILSAELSEQDQVGLMIRIIAALPGSRQVSDDIASHPGLLEDIYLDIARYTNSQNPISIPDFRSNEHVQKQLHERLKELGWFYEHRRGLWNEANHEKYQHRCITMVELAQRWFAFDGHPSTAIRSKNSLFEEQGHYGSIFMQSRSAEEYLVAYLIFNQIQERLKNNIKEAKAELERTAERGGKISLGSRNCLTIGGATKLAAAHMTALLGRGLRERYGSLNRSLARRLLPIIESGQLVKMAYPELLDALFRVITRLQGEPHKTLHKLLSEESTIEELYDLFVYILNREISKGRDILATE